MDLSNFRTDPGSLDQSFTVKVGEIVLTLMPFKNDGFLDYFSRLRKPYERLEKRGEIPKEVGRDTLSRAMAEKLVVKWENLLLPKKVFEADFPQLVKKIKGFDKLKDDDKVEIPHSRENCYIVLRHEAYDDFRGLILQLSQEGSDSAEENFEDDLGN